MIVAIALAIAGTGSAFSEVFHNAMLPSIVPYSRLGSLSGLGLSLGNARRAGDPRRRCCTAFALPANGRSHWSFLPDHVLFGLDTDSTSTTGSPRRSPRCGSLLFSIPLFLFTPDRAGTGVSREQAVRAGLADVWQHGAATAPLPERRDVPRARMLFNDGKVAIMTFGMIYASGVFGWGGAERLLVGIFLTVFAVAGGVIGGWLDDLLRFEARDRGHDRRQHRGAVRGHLDHAALDVLHRDGGTRSTGVGLSVLPDDCRRLVYLLISVLFALFITSAYANSRTMLARIAPEAEMTKFFGLYALSGQVTTFIAPIVVAFCTGLLRQPARGLRVDSAAARRRPGADGVRQRRAFGVEYARLTASRALAA